MTKMEFINTMKTKLMGEVPESEVEYTIDYYEDYFAEALQNGKSEREVIEDLGSPWLIARSIIDAKTQQTDSNSYTSRETPESKRQPETEKKFIVNTTATKILFIIILVIILLFLFAIVKTLIPIVIPVLIIYLIFRRRRH